MELQLVSMLRRTGSIRPGLQFLLTVSLLVLPGTALMTRAAELEGGFEEHDGPAVGQGRALGSVLQQWTQQALVPVCRDDLEGEAPVAQ